ncbi:MAG: hypothetical protein WCD70_06545 [Alphaproteobacteria bacterium]
MKDIKKEPNIHIEALKKLERVTITDPQQDASQLLEQTDKLRRKIVAGRAKLVAPRND